MRPHDWQTRLAEVVEAARAEPFAWGTHDCARFAARCVQAVSGRTPPLPLWTCERSAARALRAGGGLAALAGRVLGPEVAPALAQAGDVVLFDEAGREALAVCDGVRFLAPGNEGLVQVRPEAVRRCWRAC